MGNANDRRQLQEASARERAARVSELDGVREMMKTPLGRSLAFRLLQQTGMDKIIGPTPNAMALARDVGIQDYGRWLLGEIREAAPEQELAMRREAAAREQRALSQEEVDNDRSRS